MPEFALKTPASQFARILFNAASLALEKRQLVMRGWVRLLAAIILFVSTIPVSNAGIVFTPASNINVNDPTQIRTDGTLFQAWSAVGPHTINGVQFAGIGLPTTGIPSPSTWGNLTFSGFTQLNVDAFGQSLTATSYGLLLNGAVFSQGVPGTVTINNLTAGRDYLIQLWVNDDRGFGRNQTISSLGGNSQPMSFGGLNTAGQFVTGQFTAGGSGSQQFTLTSTVDGVTQIAALQVREISVVPEPSSMALMALGSIGITWFRRRRRLSGDENWGQVSI